MSETNVTKVTRRGINNSTRTVSQLKFHENDAKPNGLFVGHLKEVLVDYRKLSDDVKGLQSFAGLSIPRLTFHFTSNDEETKQRHVYQTLLPVESNIDTIPGGKLEWKVNNVLAWIKYMLDVYYLRGRELTPEEEDALAIPFEDFNGEEYVAVEPEDVVNGYATIFNNASAMLNGKFGLKDGETAKPVYLNANGGYISVWMKLLRCKKGKNGWVNVTPNGDLGFDTFIGEGVIEIQKQNNPPTLLRIDPIKESIAPQEVKKVPNIGGIGNVPGMGGMPVVGANPSPFGSPANDAYAAAGSDMPFENPF